MPGVSVTLTAQITGTCDNCTYRWNTGAETNSITVTAQDEANDQYYSCTVTAGGSCSVTPSAATVSVGPEGDTPITPVCRSCCWDATTTSWVDCFVTLNSLGNPAWSGAGTYFFAGASGPDSDKNGRSNTMAIASTGYSAVQICKDLGVGWYLPAYEELTNMSAGTHTLNGLPGANLLPNISGHYWSSTEHYGNGGRCTQTASGYKINAVRVTYAGGQLPDGKTSINNNVRCAWIDAICDDISAPTAPSNNTRCGAGEVIFSATPPTDEYTINWYTTPTGREHVSGAQAVNSFTKNLSANITYYAESFHKTSGCVSKERTAVTGTVFAVPSVTISPATPRTTPGVDVPLTATESNCDNCTFRWSTDVEANSITVGAPGPDELYYSCTVTSGDGCIATAAATVTVGPPGSTPVRVCRNCCWDGSTWVNCCVTANSHPFESPTTTPVQWSGAGTDFFAGASGSGSDRNGRANTAAISSTGTSAVQLCKDLGEGWYLPAYEELTNMSAAASTYTLNGLPGADLLPNPSSGHYWSSTEHYGNGGRSTQTHTGYKINAVRVTYRGGFQPDGKTSANTVRCAWRLP
jgi:hypothetical protein